MGGDRESALHSEVSKLGMQVNIIFLSNGFVCGCGC
jgi:hypothetical protein